MKQKGKRKRKKNYDKIVEEKMKENYGRNIFKTYKNNE